MLNRDYPFLIVDLEKRVKALEEKLGNKADLNIDNEDWDNAQLMQKWQISQRTSANYRKQGLEHYKVGGRIYYNPKQREQFIIKTTNSKTKQVKEVVNE